MKNYLHVKIDDEKEEYIELVNDHKQNYEAILSLSEKHDFNEERIVYLFLKYEEAVKKDEMKMPFEIEYENQHEDS